MAKDQPLSKVGRVIIIGNLIILFLTASMLNGGKYSDNVKITLALELLTAFSGIAFLVIILKSIIQSENSKVEAGLRVGQAMCALSLALSLGLCVGVNTKTQSMLLLVSIVGSVVSGLGLLILTIVYEIVNSHDKTIDDQ
ncbi:MAG: hypothetical protein RIC80_16860 [Cyclobacteriaceae bacterium]